MKKKITLIKPMILATGLSYGEACEALALANSSQASQHISFSIVRKPKNEGWDLEGSVYPINKLFLKNPDSFVIEV
jgi:hypothetical protein